MSDPNNLPAEISPYDWLYQAHQADPLITELAFWDTNGSFEGIPHLWEDPRSNDYSLGHTMAYFTSMLAAGHLYELDQQAPVDVSVVIEQTPAGEAPLPVREALQGLLVYGRTELQDNPEIVKIYPTDFLMALRHTSKINEATWYRQYMNDHLREGQCVESWDFNAGEVTIRDVSHMRYSSYQMFTQFNRLRLLASFEPDFNNLLPPFMHELWYENPNYEPGAAARAQLQTRADEAFDGRLALAIQEQIFGKVHDFFESAQAQLVADLESAGTEGVVGRWDDSTGEPTFYKMRGEVILDLEAGIDRRQEPQFAQLGPYPLSQETLAQDRRIAELSQAQPPPQLPEIDEATWQWHVNRQFLGL